MLVSPSSDHLLFPDSPSLREQSLDHTVPSSLTLKSETSKFPALPYDSRIVRAFLIEEVKQMKRLMQQKEKTSKKTKKNKSKGKKKQ